ncbi:MAG: hypothetical protein LBS16_03095 [Prevotellaceae bacterium]|nr:hypothetical protein [Prevotellaceae bacterium]
MKIFFKVVLSLILFFLMACEFPHPFDEGLSESLTIKITPLNRLDASLSIVKLRFSEKRNKISCTFTCNGINLLQVNGFDSDYPPDFHQFGNTLYFWFDQDAYSDSVSLTPRPSVNYIYIYKYNIIDGSLTTLSKKGDMNVLIFDIIQYGNSEIIIGEKSSDSWKTARGFISGNINFDFNFDFTGLTNFRSEVALFKNKLVIGGYDKIISFDLDSNEVNTIQAKPTKLNCIIISKNNCVYLNHGDSMLTLNENLELINTELIGDYFEAVSIVDSILLLRKTDVRENGEMEYYTRCNVFEQSQNNFNVFIHNNTTSDFAPFYLYLKWEIDDSSNLALYVSRMTETVYYKITL